MGQDFDKCSMTCACRKRFIKEQSGLDMQASVEDINMTTGCYGLESGGQLAQLLCSVYHFGSQCGHPARDFQPTAQQASGLQHSDGRSRCVTLFRAVADSARGHSHPAFTATPLGT